MSAYGLLKAAQRTPFYTQERCTISEWLNDDTCTDVSLAECIVSPAETTQLHSLDIIERYVVQAGQGLMELNGVDTFPIGPNDVVLIPAGCSQRVKNIGSEDLVFLCLCTPRFEPHHYHVLEQQDTPPIRELT